MCDAHSFNRSYITFNHNMNTTAIRHLISHTHQYTPTAQTPNSHPDPHTLLTAHPRAFISCKARTVSRHRPTAPSADMSMVQCLGVSSSPVPKMACTPCVYDVFV
jgi:hypothetical protein